MKVYTDENIRQATVPLSVEQIKEFFSNKELLYLIDYKNSELKENVFLTYLSNLDLPSEIDFEGSSFEEKEKLFVIYLTTRNIITCETLRLNLANILLRYREIDTQDIFTNLIFNEDEVQKFIQNNKELIFKWNHFLESTILFAFTCIPELKESLNLGEGKDGSPGVEHCEDSAYVGTNVVNLFSITGFMATFFSKPIHGPLTYFKPQFEDYMFRAKNLYSYYDTEENLPLHLMLANVNGEISLPTIIDAYQESQQDTHNG